MTILELFNNDRDEFKSQVQQKLYFLAQQKVKECQKNTAKELFKDKETGNDA